MFFFNTHTAHEEASDGGHASRDRSIEAVPEGCEVGNASEAQQGGFLGLPLDEQTAEEYARCVTKGHEIRRTGGKNSVQSRRNALPGIETVRVLFFGCLFDTMTSFCRLRVLMGIDAAVCEMHVHSRETHGGGRDCMHTDTQAGVQSSHLRGHRNVVSCDGARPGATRARTD